MWMNLEKLEINLNRIFDQNYSFNYLEMVEFQMKSQNYKTKMILIAWPKKKKNKELNL